MVMKKISVSEYIHMKTTIKCISKFEARKMVYI